MSRESSEEPEIAPTTSFRPGGIGISDQVIDEHKSGFVDDKVARKRGEAPALLPPHPDRDAPRTPLATRLRRRLDYRSE